MLQQRIWFSLRFFIYRWKHENNAITFGADMSSYLHIYHKDKDIVILGEGQTQGLDDTASTAEAKYPINFN